MRRPQVPLATRRILAERPLSLPERIAWRLAGRSMPTTPFALDHWPDVEQPPAVTPPLRVVIRSYREPDVLSPLIHHCRAQGAERIVVLDDESGDGSAQIARDAGAEVRETPPPIDEREARGLTWVMSVLEEDPSDAWWLALDSDEFPVAPWGLTIAEFLRLLPDDVDTVGSHFLEHFPKPRMGTTYESLVERGEGAGARWQKRRTCSRAHFKHNLLRRRPGDTVGWAQSFHSVAPRPGGLTMREAGIPLLLHHLRWRDLDGKQRHLEHMVADPRRMSPTKEWQLRQLQHVREGRWGLIDHTTATHRRWGIELAPWRRLARPWGFAGPPPRRRLRATVWGGTADWRQDLLAIAGIRDDLDITAPARQPDPARFDLAFVPSPAVASILNERFRRTTDAGIWVVPESWSAEGRSRLVAGAVMDAAAGAAARLGDPLAELRFQLQRLRRDPVHLARKVARRVGPNLRASTNR